MKSKGLGDTVYKVTRATGITRIVKKIKNTTEECSPCEERRKKLNKLVPYDTDTK
jgi:hypothetical protein